MMNWKCIGVLANTAEGAALCYRDLVRLSGKLTHDGSHPEIILHQHSFHLYNEAMEKLFYGDSRSLVELLVTASHKLKKAGAEFIIIPANSSHLAFEQFAVQAALPVISIVEATYGFCVDLGFKRPLILGTRWTMEKKLYGTSRDNGFEAVYPTLEEQETIHQIIFEDLIVGKISDSARNALYRIVEANHVRQYVDSVILGCTELPLVFNEQSPLPVVDSNTSLVSMALQLAAGGDL